MLQKNKYEHLFFDLDHTLWDFETNSAKALKILLQQFSLDEKLDEKKFIERYSLHNKQLWHLLEQGLTTRAEVKVNRFLFALKDCSIYDFELAKALDEVYLRLLPMQTKLFDGAIEVLDYLQPNYQLHIITNGFTATQNEKLRNSKIENYFKTVITSENAEANKPQIKIFDFAFEQTKATASNSLMIGDNPFADMQGALNAGMDRVLFNTMNYEHAIDITLEIKKLTDLKSFL